MNKTNVLEYLRHIRIEVYPPAPTLESLIALQRNHLLNIPFENLDIHAGVQIEIDTEKIFRKIVGKKRGGFCYELNGLFNDLLISLGYKTRLVSARVANADGGFGNEFDHMAIISEIDSQEWLVDVGFGEFAFSPLKIERGIVQHDPRGDFIIEEYDDQYLIVRAIQEGEKLNDQYLFSLAERELREFEGMCRYHQTSPESHFTRNRLCSIALPDGRVTLTDKILKLTSNKKTQEVPITDGGDFLAKLKEYFGIEMSEKN